jgi:hypothetical protein
MIEIINDGLGKGCKFEHRDKIYELRKNGDILISGRTRNGDADVYIRYPLESSKECYERFRSITKKLELFGLRIPNSEEDFAFYLVTGYSTSTSAIQWWRTGLQICPKDYGEHVDYGKINSGKIEKKVEELEKKTRKVEELRRGLHKVNFKKKEKMAKKILELEEKIENDLLYVAPLLMLKPSYGIRGLVIWARRKTRKEALDFCSYILDISDPYETGSQTDDQEKKTKEEDFPDVWIDIPKDEENEKILDVWKSRMLG